MKLSSLQKSYIEIGHESLERNEWKSLGEAYPQWGACTSGHDASLTHHLQPGQSSSQAPMLTYVLL